jgi:hypothetical protein
LNFFVVQYLLIKKQHVVLGVIYRPPQTSLNDFFTELSVLLELLCHHDRLILVGDFNINVATASSQASKLLNIMSDFDLVQYIDTATHDSGNILDLVFARDKFCSISHVSIIDGFSDHASILFDLLIPHVKSTTSLTIQTRSLKYVDFDHLTHDFFVFLTMPILWALQSFVPSIEDLIGFYNDASLTIFERNAPLISKRISMESFIEKCGMNSKMWWKQLNEVCGRVNPPVLPQEVPRNQLAQDFLTFFTDKIHQVQLSASSTTMVSNENSSVDDSVPHSITLSHFQPATQNEVKQTIMSINDSTCELDPVPTHVIKKCLPAFLPLITALANKLLTDGFPPSLKKSVIKPLYKKGKLDPESLSSYRPVSNIPFLSKVVEKLVSKRIVCHMDLLNKTNANQHAYRKMHSCETALLTMLNEAFLAIDKSMVLPLVLLDLTAAFDVVDHELLLTKCLKFGICDSAHQWLTCYLFGRNQRVSCLGQKSQFVELQCGVPQGSILGPLLFSIFISDISTVIDRHLMKHVIYADDLQIYTSSQTANISDTIVEMEACLSDIQQWLCSQKLILNQKRRNLLSSLQRTIPKLQKTSPFIFVVMRFLRRA